MTSLRTPPAQGALAATLVEDGTLLLVGHDGITPELDQVVAEAFWAEQCDVA